MSTMTSAAPAARTTTGTPIAPAPAGPDPGWTWPPSAPLHPAGGVSWHTENWAPASTVRHPWVRVGRWTLLYRRAA
jgi:hypothetical protein